MKENQGRSKMAIISFILGIFGAVTSLCAAAGCPFSIAAIVVGGLAKSHDPENKQAKLGQLFGIIGCAISILESVIFIVYLAVNGG